MSDKREQLRDLIRQKSKIAVFTGAGISTESGISDYRSKGGLWDRFQPVTLQEFVSDPEKRMEYWRRKKEMYGQMKYRLGPDQTIVNVTLWTGLGRRSFSLVRTEETIRQLAKCDVLTSTPGANHELSLLEAMGICSAVTHGSLSR